MHPEYLLYAHHYHLESMRQTIQEWQETDDKVFGHSISALSNKQNSNMSKAKENSLPSNEHQTAQTHLITSQKGNSLANGLEDGFQGYTVSAK